MFLEEKRSNQAVQIMVLLLMLLAPLSKAAVEIFSTLAIAFLGVVFFQKIFREKRLPFKEITVFDLCLLGYIFANILSIVFSVLPGMSLHAFFSKLMQSVLLFYVMRYFFRSEEQETPFLKIMGWSLLPMMLDVYFQYFFSYDFLRQRPLYYGVYVTGTFTNPNNYAGWLLMYVLPFWGYFFNERKKQDKGSVFFIGGMPSFFLMVASLLLTECRGAVVGFYMGLLFLIICHFWRQFQWRFKILQYIVTVLIVLQVLFFIVFFSKITYEWMVRYETIFTGREYFWPEAMSIVRDYFWFGSGLNTYLQVLPKYQIFNSLFYPHNSYLHMLSEVGIVGLVPFLLFLYFLMPAALRDFERHQDYFNLGLFCGILSIMVQCFVDTNLYSLTLVALFWMLVGYFLARVERRKAA